MFVVVTNLATAHLRRCVTNVLLPQSQFPTYEVPLIIAIHCFLLGLLQFTLLTYLLLCPETRVLITSSRSWGKVGHFWHDLQQSAVDSAIDGERVFAPVYRPKEDILSCDNTVIQWAVIEAVKQCQKFIECVF